MNDVGPCTREVAEKAVNEIIAIAEEYPWAEVGAECWIKRVWLVEDVWKLQADKPDRFIIVIGYSGDPWHGHRSSPEIERVKEGIGAAFGIIVGSSDITSTVWGLHANNDDYWYKRALMYDRA